jgi:glycosyltransferase involved in cell wall biosynthesis
MAKTVQVTSPVLGFGNRLDLELVCRLLEEGGFDVTPWPAIKRGKKARTLRLLQRVLSGRGRFDINLFLAPLFPEWIPLGRTNVLVPNAEGFMQMKWLKKIDLVLAKTRLTDEIFRAHGCRTEFTGFMSPDHLDESVPRRELSFFHSCSSQYKGTRRTLETWQRHPEWPRLTTVVNHNETIPPELFDLPNVEAIRKPLSNEEVLRLQNEHVFHLCCSEAEGFGHYIMEAMSCRAVPFTSDAPPMNELVQPDRGFLVACEEERVPLNQSHRYFIRHASLEQQVERALKLDPAERARMGEAGRAFFLEMNRFFARRFIEVMKSL